MSPALPRGAGAGASEGSLGDERVCVYACMCAHGCGCAYMPGRSVTECPQDTQACRPEERPLGVGYRHQMQAGCVHGGSRGLVLPRILPRGCPDPSRDSSQATFRLLWCHLAQCPSCILGLRIRGQCVCVCVCVCACACVWNMPGTCPVCPKAPAPFLVALGMQQVSLGDPLLSSLLPTCLLPSSCSEFPQGPLPAGLH